MDMDTNTLLKLDALLVPIIMLFVQAIIAWVLWSLSKKFVSSEIFSQYRDKAEPRLEKMELSVASLDTQLHQLPSKEALHDLSVKLTRLGGDLGPLQARIEGQGQLMERVERPLNLLVEHQMRGGK